LVLSIVLVSPVEEGVQGVIAVLAVLSFVFGFALGLGAGMSFLCTVACFLFSEHITFPLCVSIFDV